jgi:biopolymer transport protein ExbD
MRRAVEKMKANNKQSTFILQLTAMVDMFTIIIVFLLKSFSTSAVNITPQKGLSLPTSSSYTSPVEGVKIVVSMEGIFVEDKKIVELSDGNLAIVETERQDQDFIKKLYKALDSYAQKSIEIEKLNKEFKFDGKIVMQADHKLNYKLLKKVMYTSSLAGYADLKLATLSKE